MMELPIILDNCCRCYWPRLDFKFIVYCYIEAANCPVMTVLEKIFHQ